MSLPRTAGGAVSVLRPQRKQQQERERTDRARARFVCIIHTVHQAFTRSLGRSRLFSRTAADLSCPGRPPVPRQTSPRVALCLRLPVPVWSTV
uniref:Uncharacterized protein n=1 Tax=Knipowitschia caucasica TaxID=637954 RepID=A0AAV2KFH8_KNICA